MVRTIEYKPLEEYDGGYCLVDSVGILMMQSVSWLCMYHALCIAKYLCYKHDILLPTVNWTKSLT